MISEQSNRGRFPVIADEEAGQVVQVITRHRRGTARTGSLRRAHALWREYDVYRAHADTADAIRAMRDAMAAEDDAGFILRPHIRAAFAGLANGRRS